jgi:hypothetical protein
VVEEPAVPLDVFWLDAVADPDSTALPAKATLSPPPDDLPPELVLTAFPLLAPVPELTAPPVAWGLPPVVLPTEGLALWLTLPPLASASLVTDPVRLVPLAVELLSERPLLPEATVVSLCPVDPDCLTVPPSPPATTPLPALPPVVVELPAVPVEVLLLLALAVPDVVSLPATLTVGEVDAEEVSSEALAAVCPTNHKPPVIAATASPVLTERLITLFLSAVRDCALERRWTDVRGGRAGSDVPPVAHLRQLRTASGRRQSGREPGSLVASRTSCASGRTTAWDVGVPPAREEAARVAVGAPGWLGTEVSA